MRRNKLKRVKPGATKKFKQPKTASELIDFLFTQIDHPGGVAIGNDDKDQEALIVGWCAQCKTKFVRIAFNTSIPQELNTNCQCGTNGVLAFRPMDDLIGEVEAYAAFRKPSIIV